MIENDFFANLATSWPGHEGQVPTPLIYAYLGDAVFELLVRSYLVKQKPRKINKLHQEAVQLVCARQQKRFLEKVEPVLNEEEKDIIRRARNCKPRHIPNNVSGEDYAASTSFEALFGYLYLHGRGRRLREIATLILDDYFTETGE